MNVADYFRRGYLQREVEKKRPKLLDSLDLAIRRSVETTPLGVVKRAILSTPKRESEDAHSR